jgi:hypothetical protein
MSSFEDRRRAAVEAERSTAIAFGVALPRVLKPKLSPRAFSLGSCSDAIFSPDGSFLLALTANGAFLWNVHLRTKLRLKAVSNPHHVIFRDDGAEALIANDQSEWIRIEIPSGEAIAKFRVRHELRMDGIPCYTDDLDALATQAYDGRLLLVDANTGAVRQERMLSSGGVYGRSVHYHRAAGVIWAVVAPTSDHREHSGGTRLFRWRVPVAATEPAQVEGRWHDLNLALTKDQRHVVLHHRVDDAVDGYRMEVRDAVDFSLVHASNCGGGILPRPACTDDIAFGYASDAYAFWELDLASGVTQRYSAQCAYVDCAPASDLIAVSGKQAHVLPRSELAQLGRALSDERNQQRLELRRYSRLTTLPAKLLPPRVVVFEVPNGIHLQLETPFQARYSPYGSPRITTSDAVAVGATFREAVTSAPTNGTGPVSGGANVRDRGFLSGHISDGPSAATRCVIVSKAEDLLELTAARRKSDGTFTYDLWPTAALDPSASDEEVGVAVLKMFQYCTNAR